MSKPTDDDVCGGVWAVMVFGNHRIIGCLDTDDTPEAKKQAEDAVLAGKADAFLALIEAFELLLVPTQQGLAPVQMPYCMLPKSTPWVSLTHVQTIAFFHQMDESTRESFRKYVKLGREQTRATKAALSGIVTR